MPVKKVFLDLTNRLQGFPFHIVNVCLAKGFKYFCFCCCERNLFARNFCWKIDSFILLDFYATYWIYPGFKLPFVLKHHRQFAIAVREHSTEYFHFSLPNAQSYHCLNSRNH